MPSNTAEYQRAYRARDRSAVSPSRPSSVAVADEVPRPRTQLVPPPVELPADPVRKIELDLEHRLKRDRATGGRSLMRLQSSFGYSPAIQVRLAGLGTRC